VREGSEEVETRQDKETLAWIAARPDASLPLSPLSPPLTERDLKERRSSPHEARAATLAPHRPQGQESQDKKQNGVEESRVDEETKPHASWRCCSSPPRASRSPIAFHANERPRT
jgi:hypothetical protein